MVFKLNINERMFVQSTINGTERNVDIFELQPSGTYITGAAFDADTNTVKFYDKNGTVISTATLDISEITDNYCPILEDLRTTSGVAITAEAPFTALTDKQRIILHSKRMNTGSGAYTLNLTLPDGTTTGAKNIKWVTLTNVWENAYGNYIRSGIYLPLTYDSEKDAWLMPQDRDHDYQTMTKADIESGTGTTPKIVSAAMLRDNFYTETETDTLLDGKQDVLTFDNVPTEGSDNPVTSDGLYKTIDDSEHVVSSALNDINERVGGTYTKTEIDTRLSSKAGLRTVSYQQYTADVDITNVGNKTVEDLSSDLAAYYPKWSKTDMSAYNAIAENLSTAGTVPSVTMTKPMFDALSNVFADWDAEGETSISFNNATTKAVLGRDTYLILGTTDSAAPEWPKAETDVDLYNVQVSGGFSDGGTLFIQYFNQYNNDSDDRADIASMVTDLDASGGTPVTCKLTMNAIKAMQSAIIELDTMGESDIPNVDSYTLSGDTAKRIMVSYSEADEFVFSFTCESANTALTLPSPAVFADGFDFDVDKAQGVKFQVSIADDVASYLKISANN